MANWYKNLQEFYVHIHEEKKHLKTWYTFSDFTEWIILIKINMDINALFFLLYHFYTDIIKSSGVISNLQYSMWEGSDPETLMYLTSQYK